MTCVLLTLTGPRCGGFAVLLPHKSHCPDPCTPRSDRSLHAVPQLRKDFDWCTLCICCGRASMQPCHSALAQRGDCTRRSQCISLYCVSLDYTGIFRRSSALDHPYSTSGGECPSGAVQRFWRHFGLLCSDPCHTLVLSSCCTHDTNSSTSQSHSEKLIAWSPRHKLSTRLQKQPGFSWVVTDSLAATDGERVCRDPS